MELDLSEIGIKAAYNRFMEAHEKYDKEQIERDKIRFSKEYLAKVQAAELLMEDAAEMLEGLPDSSKELAAAKKVLQDELHSKGLSHYENVKIKYKKSRFVDKEELLKILDGDLGIYISISNVTQKSLTDHATGSLHEKELLDCIKTEEVPAEIELLPISFSANGH